MILAILLLAIACSSRRGPDRSAEMVVSNENWHQANVYVFCNGSKRLDTFRSVEMGRTAKKTLRLGGCRELALIIRMMTSGKEHFSEAIPVRDGDCFEVTIGTPPSFTMILPCQEA